VKARDSFEKLDDYDFCELNLRFDTGGAIQSDEFACFTSSGCVGIIREISMPRDQLQSFHKLQNAVNKFLPFGPGSEASKLIVDCDKICWYQKLPEKLQVKIQQEMGIGHTQIVEIINVVKSL